MKVRSGLARRFRHGVYHVRKKVPVELQEATAQISATEKVVHKPRKGNPSHRRSPERSLAARTQLVGSCYHAPPLLIGARACPPASGECRPTAILAVTGRARMRTRHSGC